MVNLMPMSQGFLWGLLGGALPEVYGLYNMRQDFHSKKPRWISSRFYWAMTFVMVMLGGGTVVFYLYSGTNVSPLLAIHIGAATPILIGNLAKAKVDFGSDGPTQTG